MPPTNSLETSTVVRHPWRATFRTTLVAGVGLLPILPEIARAAHIDTLPVVVAVLSLAAAIQRTIAVPSVEAWLRLHTRWLAAEPETPDTPYAGRHRKDQ